MVPGGQRDGSIGLEDLVDKLLLIASRRSQPENRLHQCGTFGPDRDPHAVPFAAVVVLPVGGQAKLADQAPFTPPWAQ